METAVGTATAAAAANDGTFSGRISRGICAPAFFDCTAFDSGVLPGLRDGRISLQEKQIDLDRKKLEKSVGWEKKNDCNFIKKGV